MTQQDWTEEGIVQRERERETEKYEIVGGGAGPEMDGNL